MREKRNGTGRSGGARKNQDSRGFEKKGTGKSESFGKRTSNDRTKKSFSGERDQKFGDKPKLGFGRSRDNESKGRPSRDFNDKPSFRNKKDDGFGEKKSFRRKEDGFDSKPSFRKKQDGDFGERKSYRRNDDGFDAKPSFRKKQDGDFSERKSYKRNDDGFDSKPSFRKKQDGDFDERKPFRRNDDRSDSKPSFRKKQDGDFGERKPFRRNDDRSDSKPSFRKKQDGDFDERKPFRRNDDRSDSKPSFRKKQDGDFGERRSYKRNDEGFDSKPSFRKKQNDDFEDRSFKSRKRDADIDDVFDKPKRSFSKNDDEDFGFERKKSRDYEDDFYGSERKSDNYGKRDFKGRSQERKSFHKKAEQVKEDDGTTRLNKYLSNAGICSRREADTLIQTGVVTVNGEIITELGYKIKPGDKVVYGGNRIKTERKVYLLLNKPKDYITTTDDPQARRTVMDLVKGACKERVYPVGRLDRNTTGVLLLTNDGDLTKKLLHPKHGIPKVYHVTLDKNVSKDDMDKLYEGIELEDGLTKVDNIAYASASKSKKEVGVEIHSGKNRIVRRLFEHLGYQVTKLDRVSFAGLTKKDLSRGKYRFLEEKEIGYLRMIS